MGECGSQQHNQCEQESQPICPGFHLIPFLVFDE
jgi:hypothetical protein